MEGTELVSFQIISSVGTARSMYIEAIQEAKKLKFDLAQELLEEGDSMFLQGHHAHAKLVQSEAGGTQTDLSLLLVHAEDQLMSAEGFKIIAAEFIDVYKRMSENK